MALTEHLLKNISSRLKRDAAHKARNYNSSKIRADFILHSGGNVFVDCVRIFHYCPLS